MQSEQCLTTCRRADTYILDGASPLFASAIRYMYLYFSILPTASSWFCVVIFLFLEDCSGNSGDLSDGSKSSMSNNVRFRDPLSRGV